MSTGDSEARIESRIGLRIGLLLGGAGAEHQPSLRAGEAIAAVLSSRGHQVETLFVDRDADLVLRQRQLDAAFLAVRGRYATDGCLQGLLELRGIPYTGPGLLTAALAANRARVRDLLRLNNLPTAAAYAVDVSATESVVHAHQAFGFPVWVHPIEAPPDAGAILARDELELEAAVEQAARFSERVSVERFVEGRLFQVATLHGRALGLIDVGGPRGRLTSARHRSMLKLAERACEAIGAEGPALVELVLSERTNEVIRSIDVTPLLQPAALYPRMAEAGGLGFAELVGEILSSARLHAHGHRADRRARQDEAGDTGEAGDVGVGGLPFEGPERRSGVPPSAH